MEKETYVIVGLGNPGLQYAHTRHNMGWDAVDILAARWGVSLNRNRCKGMLCEADVQGKRVVLCQPQTMMNLSGECVSQLVSWYKIPRDHLLVLCDDIDIGPGRLRMRASGSAGTHNGLRSILQYIPADFPRLRIGVGDRPEGWDLVRWVIGKPLSREEQEVLTAACVRAADVCEVWLKNGMARAQEMANTKASR